VPALSRCKPVNALHVLPSSAAEAGFSQTKAGMKRAKSGFMTSSEAQMIATLISMEEKMMA
jgi:hypothetical protein